jgi:hypothetical protein
VICHLCRQRRARRACPALGQQICAVCCGTKRLVEIACPDSCPYLASAREHPPAAVVRQQQDELLLLARTVRDLNERQSRLLFLLFAVVARHEAPELFPLLDSDVAEAAGALAATYETSARGVIYEHRAASVPAEQMVRELKAVLTEAGRSGGTAFERDAGLVLRRIEEAARQVIQSAPGHRRAFLDLVARVVRTSEEEQVRENPEADSEPSRLIIP